ncbi:MAG: type II toxin-antitoxin system RelE/ParE family toxin [Actinomycetes bacterium]
MSRFRVEFRPAAARQLRKIEPQTRERLRGIITLLAEDPRPPASRQLRGRSAWRVRVGDYRVNYTIEDGLLVVVVITIGHRREVYD